MRVTILIFCCVLLFAFIIPSRKSSDLPYPPISDEFKLLWKAKTGISTFRTNVAFNPGELIIGSNGQRLMDYNFIDRSSGVYIVDRKNGDIKKHFGEEVIGDMDVNGIVLYKDKIYFGNDNEEFLCATRDGKILWRNPTSGDIEHEPLLLDIKGKNIIVYASEEGEVQAVDPENGTSLWRYYTPDFNGWKPGDNQNIFKVRAYFRNSTSFFTKPIAVDLNADKVKDLVYNTYDSKIYAINGLTGKLLWNYEHDSHLSYFSVLEEQNGDPSLMFLTSNWIGNYDYNYKILRIDRKGSSTVLYSGNLGNGFGLNALKLSSDQVIFPCTDSLAVFSTKTNQIEWVDRSITYLNQFYYPNSEKVEQIRSRNAADPLIAQELINYKGDTSCIVLLSQRDPANSDHGVLEIISLNDKKLIKRFSLPSTTEMKPIITDVNQDGKKDILVNCSDGYTYCYELPL